MMGNEVGGANAVNMHFERRSVTVATPLNCSPNVSASGPLQTSRRRRRERAHSAEARAVPFQRAAEQLSEEAGGE